MLTLVKFNCTNYIMKRSKMRIKKLVGHNLTALRESKGLSVIALAYVCKVSRQSIYNVERSKHLPNDDLLEALCKEFKIEEHELFQIKPKFN